MYVVVCVMYDMYIYSVCVLSCFFFVLEKYDDRRRKECRSQKSKKKCVCVYVCMLPCV